MFLDRHAEYLLAVLLQRPGQPLRTGQPREGQCQQNAPDLDADARIRPCGVLDEPTQVGFRVLGILFWNDASIEPERDPVRNHVGVDPAGDESDVDGRMHDAGHLRALLLQIRPRVVNAAQNAGRRRQRIDARLRHRRVALPALDDHFEVQAAVMCCGDRVRESGPDCEIGLTEAALQDPAWADVAANLLVVGKMQFQTAVEHMPGGGGLPQDEQCIRVGREIRFADSHPPAVHRRSMDRVIDDLGAVRILRPA